MKRTTRRLACFAAVAVSLAILPVAGAQELKLPNQGQVRFAVIGDMGTASRGQREVRQQMSLFRQKFPFSFVITVGDNILGSETAADFKARFEAPYAELLSAGVKFDASVGNHDNPEQRNYGPFSMNGQRYYTFRTSEGVRFFALDSNYLDAQQLAWLEKQAPLPRSTSRQRAGGCGGSKAWSTSRDTDLFGGAGQAVAAADAACAHGQAGAHQLLEDLRESGLGQAQCPGDAGDGHRPVPRPPCAR